MISFNKLVQTKRSKMLALVVLLVFCVCLRPTTSINLTYIVKKEGDMLQPNCIAEENTRYAGIGWVFPIPDQKEHLPNISHKFVPTITNDFNCNFSKLDKCTKIWTIKNWQIDADSARTFDLIFDDRWDDFPLLFTSNKPEFSDRIEIRNVFRAGFSLRAAKNVEILACEGWNPHNYPCYHLNVTDTEVFLHKHLKFPETPTSDPALDSYQTFSNILSDDEWRNFILSFDHHGTLKLIDANVNRTVIQYQDQQPLKPLYLLFKSAKPALWKVHQNQFIYTETPQTSRLGPILNLASRDLCVSLYVSTCENCAMRFIIMKDNQRKVLKEVEPTEQYQWKLVKLKEENVDSEKLNIFVETTFVDATLNSSEGFWAVDNVRVCHENEVKVTFLKLKNGTDESIDNNVSCQVVQHPMWRPKKLVYGKIKDFPAVVTSSNATSINLSWAQEDPDKQINYFIQYEANDICTSEPFNLRRVKSNGFLMTKLDEITVNNLIPYTKYNITFSSMLHEQEKKLFVTTAESDKPTVRELPNKIQIQVTDSAAYVSWDKIDCKSIYGHVLYAINITNNLANVTKELKVQTENTVEIDNLEPFTAYTVNIVTARSFENIQNNNNTIGMNINFTTKAGVAPPVANLELYAIDKNSVAFRYDLPKNPKGVPVYVQVMRCNPIVFKKCKTSTARIEKCSLWPKKYCVEVNNLIPYQRHTFKVSIKNIDSVFGDETVVDGFTQEQVPGAPSNITYRIVDCKVPLDYCHLNITWHHPYNQNGTITAFNIVLNATTPSTNVSENILEVHKISNKSYVPVYEHQIQYIPFSKHYELYLQSVNVKFKSDFTHIHVKTADIGDHIDQSPKLLAKSSTAAVFKVAPVDPRLKSYTVTVIVQDFDKSQSVPDDLDETLQDHLCHKFGNTWVSQTLEVNNQTENITIGERDESMKTLEAATQYCVTFIVKNNYKDTEHQVVYYEKLETPSSNSIEPKTASSSQNNHLYALLLLLLLIPIGFLIYRYIRKRRPKKSKQQQNQENVYESLPFEECEDNCVANETYDHLLHK